MPTFRTIPNGEIYTAHTQWASRPNDQRFVTLDDLRAFVATRQEITREKVVNLGAIGDTLRQDGKSIYAQGANRADLTYHSFAQLSAYAGAPVSYLRDLPTELALTNLQYGLKRNATERTKLLFEPNEIRGFRGPEFGTIWDMDVVDAVRDFTDGTGWQVPASSYAHTDPLRSTTLYASKSDVFLFLVDPTRPIDVKGDVMYRGFIASNSEVGGTCFSLTTFLYRRVCDNRIIWGAEQATEIRMRHTSGAPARFIEQAAPAIVAYANASAKPLEARILAAKALTVATGDSDTPVADAAIEWLRKQGFTAKTAKAGIEAAIREEGDPSTLWNVVQGLTAYARTIEHTDTRVDLETRASKLLAAV